MKRKTNIIITALLALTLLMAFPAVGSAVEVKTDDGQVASSSEMAPAQEIDTEDLTPVSADQIKEGDYDITVQSSSSMFNITACKLHVKDGKMTADMTLGGTGYEKLYMGTAEEAAKASDSDFIGYTEGSDGKYTYTVPVESLDKETDCAAFSKKRQKWYPRTLVFQASSLPDGAVDASVLAASKENAAASDDKSDKSKDSSKTDKKKYIDEKDADKSQIKYGSTKLGDGKYTIEVELKGGSGRASVKSPAEMKISSGFPTATIEWSSPNYDYMVIDNVKYEPVNSDGNSQFKIPITKFDGGMEVIADTTAMSQPHEIQYTLNFKSDTAKRKGLSVKTEAIILVLLVVAAIGFGFLNGRRRLHKKERMAVQEEDTPKKKVSRKKSKLH